MSSNSDLEKYTIQPQSLGGGGCILLLEVHCRENPTVILTAVAHRRVLPAGYPGIEPELLQGQRSDRLATCDIIQIRNTLDRMPHRTSELLYSQRFHYWPCINRTPEPKFVTFKEPRNQFQRIDSADSYIPRTVFKLLQLGLQEARTEPVFVNLLRSSEI
jgi:hypothetical protein